MQHACSELTHDTIYKSKTKASSRAIRASAKAIALSNAVDDYFMTTFNELREASKDRHAALAYLHDLYHKFINKYPDDSKLGTFILEEIFQLIDDDTFKLLSQYLRNNQICIQQINSSYSDSQLHRESVVLLVYYFLTNKKNELYQKWPISVDKLTILAHDIGEKLPD